MTNKTQIAELTLQRLDKVRYLLGFFEEGYDPIHDKENFELMRDSAAAVSALIFTRSKLEAAEACIALVAGGIEAAVKLQERAEKAEAELAKLKGDAVPVITDEMAYAFHAAITDSSLGSDDCEDIKRGLAAVAELFTHAQPVPAVVLPSRFKPTVSRLTVIGTGEPIAAMSLNPDGGWLNYSRVVHILKEAGITVKSADGVGE